MRDQLANKRCDLRTLTTMLTDSEAIHMGVSAHKESYFLEAFWELHNGSLAPQSLRLVHSEFGFKNKGKFAKELRTILITALPSKRKRLFCSGTVNLAT